MASRSSSRDNRSRTHSRSPKAPPLEYSRSRSRSEPRDRRESLSPSPHRNGRYRDSRSPSRDVNRSSSRGRSRSRSEGLLKSTKIVVERLTKNVNEDHLREIFGQYGEIEDMDLPINRTFGTNRGTAYILYVNEADAESAIAHMHEAQLDGAAINVSIVLPRRQFSPEPPAARRGGGIDPRIPYNPGRGPRGGMGGTGGRFPPRGNRFDRPPPPSDTWRPRSITRSRSPPVPPPRARYRSRSPSYSRSRSPPPTRRSDGRRGRRYDDGTDNRRRSPSRDSYDSYEGRRGRSRSRNWSSRRR